VHAGGVLQYDEMPVMLRHRKSELFHRSAAVREEPFPKGSVYPGPRYDARTVLRNPLLGGEAGQLRDAFRRVHSPLVERRLDGVDALLDRGSPSNRALLIFHCALLAADGQYSRRCSARQPAVNHAGRKRLRSPNARDILRGPRRQEDRSETPRTRCNRISAIARRLVPGVGSATMV